MTRQEKDEKKKDKDMKIGSGGDAGCQFEKPDQKRKPNDVGRQTSLRDQIENENDAPTVTPAMMSPMAHCQL